ncbi:MAG: hypothetical protein LBD06_12390 [Candidatus Accumulibacter sp.]|nr:hypothetical protein [Accumulibacter sp.]
MLILVQIDDRCNYRKTEDPSARFFIPHPARSAQADLSSVFSSCCPLIQRLLF